MLNLSNKHHSLTVSYLIEKVNNSKYSQCILFLNLAKNFSKKDLDKTNIKFSSLELRALAHGIGEILTTGNSTYAKYANTANSIYAKSKEDKKSIFLNYDRNKAKYYINIVLNGNNVGIEYTMLEFNAIKDALSNLCNTVDNRVFDLNSF